MATPGMWCVPCCTISAIRWVPDPRDEIYPLSTFEPRVQRVMGATRQSIYKAVMQPQ